MRAKEGAQTPQVPVAIDSVWTLNDPSAHSRPVGRLRNAFSVVATAKAPPRAVPGVEPFIRKRGTPHGSRLEQVRPVGERAIGCIKGLRRLQVRDGRREEAIEA